MGLIWSPGFAKNEAAVVGFDSIRAFACLMPDSISLMDVDLSPAIVHVGEREAAVPMSMEDVESQADRQ